MYRITKTLNEVYALKIRNIEDDMENIESFLESDDVVMLSEDLFSVADLLGMEESEIEIVEKY